MTEQNKLYSGVFFDNGLHMTWEFGPDCTLPRNIIGFEDFKEGQEQLVQLYAVIHEKSVGLYACFIVLGVDKVYKQSDTDNPLHITLYNGKDASRNPIQPKVAGELLNSYKESLARGHSPIGYSPLSSVYTWIGKWGYKTVK